MDGILNILTNTQFEKKYLVLCFEALIWQSNESMKRKDLSEFFLYYSKNS